MIILALILILQSIFHLCGMIIIFSSFDLSLLWFLCFVSVKLLSDCCFLLNCFVAFFFGLVSNFIIIGITIDNIGFKWYRTRIFNFTSKKYYLLFLPSAPNVAGNTFQMLL